MADRNANIVVSVRGNASSETQKIATSFRTLAAEATSSASNFERLERQFIALQNSEIRAATATGQFDRALALIRSEMDAAGQGTVRYNQLLVQQVQVQQRVERAAQQAAKAQRQEMDELRSSLQPIGTAANQAQAGVGALGGTLGEVQQVLGGLGIALGAQQIVAFGKAAAEDALQLRETKNSLKAVAGDAQTYTTILGEARRQQLLFGGSLQENIDGLQGLAVTSRNTGAQLSTLIDLQKRLTVLNPQQGAQGGLIALNEALAGNISSLSRRFNIPRDTIRALGDESKPVAERLKVLDAFLNNVGITSQSVAGRVDQDALAFRRLGQELGDLRLNAGDELATAFSGAATGLARLIGLINSNPQALAELKGLFSGKSTINQGDIEQASQQIARQQAESLLMSRAGAARFGGADEFARVVDQLAQFERAGGVAKARAEELTRQIGDGPAAIDAYRQSLNALTSATDASVQATDANNLAMVQVSPAALAAAHAAEEQATALQRDAQESVTASAKSQLLTIEKQRLEASAVAAARAILGTAGSMSEEGIQALLAAKKIDEVTAAHLRLLSAQNAPQPPQPLGNIGRKNLDIDGLSTLEDKRQANAFIAAQNAKTEAAARAAQAAQAANEARRAQILALGTDTQRLAQLEADLADKRRRFGASSAEAIRAETDLRQEKQRQAEAAERERNKQNRATSVAAGKGLSTLAKSDIALAGDLESQLAAVNSQLARGNLTQLQRNQLLLEQRDLEKKIADEKDRQLQSALDARIAAIEDRKQRRQEDREITQAQRILNSRASERFKVEARDQLELIPLQQQRRALDLARQIREAGGVVPPIGQIASGPLPGVPKGVGALPVLPALPSLPTGALGAGVDVKVYVDGQEIAAKVITTLREGRQQAQAAGSGRS